MLDDNSCTELSEYRPFASVAELAEAWGLKYPSAPQPPVPVIWVKGVRQDGGSLNLVTRLSVDGVSLGNSWCNLAQLYQDYRFPDGSVIGARL